MTSAPVASHVVVLDGLAAAGCPPPYGSGLSLAHNELARTSP